MGRAIAHRGPDDVQYYDDGTLALVFRRLSIIDIEGGDQPFFNETRTLLGVVNGEIYNHVALRRTLEARHQFASRSDSEIPLHAYEEWGTEALSRLNGMFAIAIWDKQEKQLLLARDRLGIKPLYVCRIANGFLFASELKALLAHPQCPRGMDWGALGHAAIMQGCETSYVKGIGLLPGGEFLKVSPDHRFQGGRYWQLDEHLGSAPYGLDAAAYRNRYRELLEEVTLEHLQADTDVGMLLSGGLDSSLLAAIISRKQRNVPCFTMVERTTYLAGDVQAAGEVTNQLGLPWYPVLFDYRTILGQLDFSLRSFEQNIWMMDSPRFDLEWVFKGELNRVARAIYPGLKVLILGQGADEFAGGYSSTLRQTRLNWADYLRDHVDPNLNIDRNRQQSVPPELGNLRSRESMLMHSSLGSYHNFMRLLVRQLQHFNLWHEDRTSSWQSLEARVPFLDHRIVELLASVPEVLHEELFWNKRIVRDAMQHFLPSYDVNRPKVGFFETDDSRSIELVVNGIVERVVPAFREQYMDNQDFIFSRDKIDSLARRVRTRAPGYFHDATQLIECMAIAVFDRQLQARDESPSTDRRNLTPTLSVVSPEAWAAVGAAMAAVPGVRTAWSLNDRIALHQGSEIVRSLTYHQKERYILTAEGRVCSHIEVPDGHPWLGNLLSGLGTPDRGEFTVQDWIDELHAAPAQFLEVLDVLDTCGFVTPGADLRSSNAQDVAAERA